MTRIDVLQDVVSPVLLQRTGDMSLRLRELGIPHVLIGGLAVGVHGHLRATKDVDFLVGPEAFESVEPLLVYREELKDLVRIGETDIMSVPDAYPGLAEELQLEDDVPVISLQGLVLMKLDANRPRDREDVRVLLEISPRRIREVRDHILEHAPKLVDRLAEILGFMTVYPGPLGRNE